jgi:hypothetical protein
METGVFSVGSAPRLYSEDPRPAEWQFSWTSACEERTKRLVWNGRQPGTQLVELSVDKSSVRPAVTRRPEWGEAEESPSVEAIDRKRLVETNRLRTLVCMCQWIVKCSAEWCIQVVNKFNSHPVCSHTHTHTHINTWRYGHLISSSVDRFVQSNSGIYLYMPQVISWRSSFRAPRDQPRTRDTKCGVSYTWKCKRDMLYLSFQVYWK